MESVHYHPRYYPEDIDQVRVFCFEPFRGTIADSWVRGMLGYAMMHLRCNILRGLFELLPITLMLYTIHAWQQ
jgi:hypothetical protein